VFVSALPGYAMTGVGIDALLAGGQRTQALADTIEQADLIVPNFHVDACREAVVRAPLAFRSASYPLIVGRRSWMFSHIMIGSDDIARCQPRHFVAWICPTDAVISSLLDFI
jgi:hypothetical protein